MLLGSGYWVARCEWTTVSPWCLVGWCGAGLAVGTGLIVLTDLVTVAREGRIRTDFDPVSLEAISTDCWATVEAGNASLRWVVARTILADESRLRQVFENRFENAVTHGGRDVTDVVDVLPGFYVTDDGPGIPPENRVDVFEAGYSTIVAGTGFGMRIVERMVDAHDWDSTESEMGARFEITGVTVLDA